MADRGAWPVAGGLLDQSAFFVDFAQFAWSEVDRFASERRLSPPEG